MQTDKQENLFKRWLNEYPKLIYRVVRTYADLPHDREDLFQEILVQLWSSFPAFRGQAKETTWIYRVALNTALTWTRTQKPHKKAYSKHFPLSSCPHGR